MQLGSCAKVGAVTAEVRAEVRAVARLQLEGQYGCGCAKVVDLHGRVESEIRETARPRGDSNTRTGRPVPGQANARGSTSRPSTSRSLRPDHAADRFSQTGQCQCATELEERLGARRRAACSTRLRMSCQHCTRLVEVPRAQTGPPTAPNRRPSCGLPCAPFFGTSDMQCVSYVVAAPDQGLPVFDVGASPFGEGHQAMQACQGSRTSVDTTI